MNEDHCRSTGYQQPRLINGRHLDDCLAHVALNDPCRGCQPCERSHCGICATVHAAGICAECLAVTRETLHDIARMCSALPEEVEHRGIDGEAMVLLGPVTDPEAWGHVTASYRSGRLPEGWIEAAHGKECPLLVNEACAGCAGGELHPLLILGTWDMCWRDVLEHQEPEGVAVVGELVAYLDMQMTYMAGNEDVPFEDFARDLRACRAHLEAVLHDGEQVDRGAPCMAIQDDGAECRAHLVREWGDVAVKDGWQCPKCGTRRTDAQYRFIVTELHRENAGYLTASDMVQRTGVPRGTLTGWASRGDVAKRKVDGRVVYRVADVLKRMADDVA